MAVETGIFSRDDRLAQRRRDIVVADDDPPLDRKLPDDVAAGAVDPRDRVRDVVVEG